MLKQTDQTSRKYRIAAMNRKLDQAAICPGNHEVGYYRGWYYVDEDAQQRPDVTRLAREMEEDPQVEVAYSPAYNSYVFVDAW